MSKVHKIEERLEDGDARRQGQLPKGAFDIYRLLRAIDTAELASEFGLLQTHEISSRVTSEALSTFESLFGFRSATGTSLLVRSVGAPEDPAFITESSVALSRDLLDAISE